MLKGVPAHTTVPGVITTDAVGAELIVAVAGSLPPAYVHDPTEASTYNVVVTLKTAVYVDPDPTTLPPEGASNHLKLPVPVADRVILPAPQRLPPDAPDNVGFTKVMSLPREVSESNPHVANTLK